MVANDPSVRGNRLRPRRRRTKSGAEACRARPSTAALLVLIAESLVVATGFAMYAASADIDSLMRLFGFAAPWLGGLQSARVLHHAGMWLLVAFAFVSSVVTRLTSPCEYRIGSSLPPAYLACNVTSRPPHRDSRRRPGIGFARGLVRLRHPRGRDRPCLERRPGRADRCVRLRPGALRRAPDERGAARGARARDRVADDRGGGARALRDRRQRRRRRAAHHHPCRSRHLRRLPARVSRSDRPPLPLSLHQLHELRPALLHRHSARRTTAPRHRWRRSSCATTAAREYDDPLDRRFHAQPNACPEVRSAARGARQPAAARSTRAIRSASPRAPSAPG